MCTHFLQRVAFGVSNRKKVKEMTISTNKQEWFKLEKKKKKNLTVLSATSVYLFLETRLRELKDDITELLSLSEFHWVVRQIRNKLRFKIRQFVWWQLVHGQMFALGRAIRIRVPSLSPLSFPSWDTDRGPCCVGTLVHGALTGRHIMVAVSVTTRNLFVRILPWMSFRRIVSKVILVTGTIYKSWIEVRKFSYILCACLLCPWWFSALGFAEEAPASLHFPAVALFIVVRFTINFLRPAAAFCRAAGTTRSVRTRAKHTQLLWKVLKYSRPVKRILATWIQCYHLSQQ